MRNSNTSSTDNWVTSGWFTYPHLFSGRGPGWQSTYSLVVRLRRTHGWSGEEPQQSEHLDDNSILIFLAMVAGMPAARMPWTFNAACHASLECPSTSV